MKGKHRLAGTLLLLGGAAIAQVPLQPPVSSGNAPVYSNVLPSGPGNGYYSPASAVMDGAMFAQGAETTARSGLESHSLPGELIEDVANHAPGVQLGPTAVEDVRLLMDGLGLADLFGDSGIRAFGWLEAGYTGASTGSGLLATQPRQNRFGNEFLVNQRDFLSRSARGGQLPRPKLGERRGVSSPVDGTYRRAYAAPLAANLSAGRTHLLPV